mgnify:CR=1 FL=1
MVETILVAPDIVLFFLFYSFSHFKVSQRNERNLVGFLLNMSILVEDFQEPYLRANTKESKYRVIIKILEDKPVAYRGIFSKIFKDVCAGVFLSQLYYWQDRGERKDGYIYKSYKEWYDETGLSRSNLDTARSKLKKSGVLSELKEGLPLRLFYKINNEVLIDVIEKWLDKELASLQDSANSNATSCKQQCDIVQCITENTTENTTENQFQCDKSQNENDFLTEFKKIRDLFPGKKRGLETEFQSFKKWDKHWKTNIFIIPQKIQNQILGRAREKKLGRFVKEWQGLGRYLKEKTWEEEFLQEDYPIENQAIKPKYDDLF